MEINLGKRSNFICSCFKFNEDPLQYKQKKFEAIKKAIRGKRTKEEVLWDYYEIMYPQKFNITLVF